MTEKCIGIDLGTTYSCLAYIDEDGDPVVEKNFEQEETTPSVILFDEKGEIIVGSPAKDMSVMYEPGRTITAIKRQMGSDYTVEIDGESYNPMMLSAVILRKMINDFNDNHGCDIKSAVITVPAYFGQNERDCTKIAGSIAGLEKVDLINEPTAAAIAFGYGNRGEGMKRVLVYDLGGGTFDVTILEIDDGAFTAVATDGERYLGGKDWDAAISQVMKQKISEESGIDIETLNENPEVNQTMVIDSEVLKKRLSTAQTTKGTLTIDSSRVVYSISREEFEAATESLVAQTIEVVNKVMASKGFTEEDIDDVILVGGSSRMPQIKAAIANIMPESKIKIFDPDQSVAKGAAIYAKSLADAENRAMIAEDVAEEPVIGEDGEVVVAAAAVAAAENTIVVKNVLSKTFGIRVIYEDGTEKISNLIFRNEVLPIEETKVYYPVDDGQTSIKVEIYEDAAVKDGEGINTELIEGTPVGEFVMDLPDLVTKDTPIEVKFTATEEGILVADVDCLGQHCDYTIENDLKMTAEEIQKSQGLMERVSKGN